MIINHYFLLLMPAFSFLISSIYFTIYLYQHTECSATVLFFNKTCRFGKFLKSRYILGAKKLDQWAITLSLKDGCFQAYLLVVIIFSLPFSLRILFWDLSDQSGLFPFWQKTLAPNVCLFKLRFFVFGVSKNLVSFYAP